MFIKAIAKGNNNFINYLKDNLISISNFNLSANMVYSKFYYTAKDVQGIIQAKLYTPYPL